VTTGLLAPPLAPPTPIQIVAHRGFSSRQPESTLAAYQEAVDFALTTGARIGLECDVHLTADRQLVCLHDATVDRTSNASGAVSDWTLAGLRSLDFGSWKVPDPTAEQRALVSLADLLDLVQGARARGADVNLVIETKQSRRRAGELERRVSELLTGYGWDHADAPVRLITFSVPAAKLLGQLLPDLHRTLLVTGYRGRPLNQVLPAGVRVVGVDLRVLRRDIGLVDRARRRGHQVHAWTVNDEADIALCRDLGVTGITSDHPDRVLETLARTAQPAPASTPRPGPLALAFR
jgi:glycerophosphoryl diester phosphodiesterase